jgi:hypothetical protein
MDPGKCTQEQLDMAQFHLPDCKNMEGCSLNFATACPNLTWLEKEFSRICIIERNATSGQSGPPIAIHVGRNKRFDAVNTLRMLSSDAKFDKESLEATDL